MSVAAMTMDDQRPLMKSYDKMSKQCEQNTLHAADAGGGGAPPSGPASPTPSGSEEPAAVHQFHHTHHHHAHHHHQHHHARHQQQVPPHLSAEQQQQQQSPPSPSTAAAGLSHHHNQQQQLLQQQPQPSTVAEAVAAVEHRQRLLEEEIESLKLEQTRLSQQCADAQRREKILMRRLANKEQEFQDYVSQIAEYKAAQAPTALALRSALLDPAVNLLFEKLKKELKATKAKLEETQNELSAWKFTPDSNTGKRLMAKCRLLYQENEELGKMTSNGRLAKLETELAMQKSFCEEVKKSQSELDDFLPELDEDVEGMQSTILFLQQELKTTRDRIQILEKENCQLKTGTSGDSLKEAETDSSSNSLHNALNGTVADGTAAPAAATVDVAAIDAIPYKSANSSNNLQQFHTSTTAINSKDGKFPAKALETIDETAVARNFASSKEFYNGNELEQLPIASTGLDEASNGSGFSAAATVATSAAVALAAPTGVLRTAASRKRNFDGDSNEKLVPANTPTAAAAVLMHVAAPRTLPPKKSKLRRASVQSTELNEFENCGAQPPIAGNAVAVAPPAEVLNIVDNAVAGMANEENPPVVQTADEPMDGGVAQRIMTRRRSVRTQQNGGDGIH